MLQTRSFSILQQQPDESSRVHPPPTLELQLTEAINSRETALMLAARYGHAETVIALKQHNAAEVEEDAYGNTALTLANSGHVDVVRVLS